MHMDGLAIDNRQVLAIMIHTDMLVEICHRHVSAARHTIDMVTHTARLRHPLGTCQRFIPIIAGKLVFNLERPSTEHMLRHCLPQVKINKQLTKANHSPRSVREGTPAVVFSITVQGSIMECALLPATRRRFVLIRPFGYCTISFNSFNSYVTCNVGKLFNTKK